MNFFEQHAGINLTDLVNQLKITLNGGTGITTVGTNPGTSFIINLDANIEELNNVATATDGQILKNVGGTTWIGDTLDLTDVGVTLPSSVTGHVIVFDGSGYTSAFINLGQLGNVTDTSTDISEFLISTGPNTWENKKFSEVQDILKVSTYLHTNFNDVSYVSSAIQAISESVLADSIKDGDTLEIKAIIEMVGDITTPTRSADFVFGATSLASFSFNAPYDIIAVVNITCNFYEDGGVTYMKYFDTKSMSSIGVGTYDTSTVKNTPWNLAVDNTLYLTLDSLNNSAGDIVLKSFTLKHIK